MPGVRVGLVLLRFLGVFQVKSCNFLFGFLFGCVCGGGGCCRVECLQFANKKDF